MSMPAEALIVDQLIVQRTVRANLAQEDRMAYDKSLADRIRTVLKSDPRLIEKQAFGGISFMMNGNVACGVIGDEMMVRVGPAAHDEAVQRPHARIFDFSGRPSRGWIMVGAGGLQSKADLKRWVQRGVDFALSLPVK